MIAQNLIFLALGPIEKVGKNNTSKSMAYFLEKEEWEKDGVKNVRFNLIPANAWGKMIDMLESAKAGDVYKEVKLKVDGRIYKEKCYSDVTIGFLGDKFDQPKLAKETSDAVDKWVSELGVVLGYSKPASTAEPSDDLPF